jgi:hypothetical protein|tara:strand:+ start:1890 stop:2321 length:432 start_codon:yes stop_codon:yes gene_type:complete
MGHWAEIDENNIVVNVIVIKEEELDKGHWGDKSKWIKTSYNTREGKYYIPSENQNYTKESPDQSKAIRFRYARKGMFYDKDNDVFLFSPQPFASWTLNKTTYLWEAPIEQPSLTDEELEAQKYYWWDEDVYQADNKKGWVISS